MNLFELVDYVAFGLALLIGIGVGRKMRPKPPPPLQAICSCGHGFGQHEDGRKCQEHGKAPKYDSAGAWLGYRCTCLRYDGPSLEFLGHQLDLP